MKKNLKRYSLYLVSNRKLTVVRRVLTEVETWKEVMKFIYDFTHDEKNIKKYSIKGYERYTYKDFKEGDEFKEVHVDFGDYYNFIDIIDRRPNEYEPEKPLSDEEERKFEVEHMLTVEKFIEILKKFDPKALVCAFEMNSDAWISQDPDIVENILVRTVSKEKEIIRKNNLRFYKDEDEMERDIKTMFRYVKEHDVLIRF